MRQLSSVTLALMLVIVSGLSGGCDKPGNSQKDLPKLQGVWGSYLGGFYHSKGREVVFLPTASPRQTHRIRGDKWIELDADAKPTGVEKTIILDESKVPKQMQLAYTRKRGSGKSEEKVRERILYVLEGDRLTLHRALADEATSAPQRLLEFGKPVDGLDGKVSCFQRMKDE